jgi:hypothetical protein
VEETADVVGACEEDEEDSVEEVEVEGRMGRAAMKASWGEAKEVILLH